MSEVWVSYFLFFAKVATVVLGILVVAIGLALIAKKKRIPSGTIELKNLGDHFQKIKQSLQFEVFSKEELKEVNKEAKEKIKKEKKEVRPRVYVLNFDGDLRAQAASSLREEGTALLSVAKEGDEVFYKGELIFNSQDLLVVGKHNIEHLLAALALGNQFGLSIESMINAAKKYKGLAHRLEFVTRIDQVDYYNDSKSTNAISTITAINALSERYNTITLIAGGIAKNEDYSQMFRLINKKVNNAVLIGESKDFFAQSISGCSVIIEESLEGAIATAKKHALEGAVLLSPGCASFDMFSDFSERGEVFKQLIHQPDNG